MKSFQYSHFGLTGREKLEEKIFSAVPGFLSWIILMGSVMTSFLYPVTTICILIAFLLYWLFKLWYLNIFLLFSYIHLWMNKTTHWNSYIEDIDKLIEAKKFARNPKSFSKLRQKLSFKLHQRRLQHLQKSGAYPPLSTEIFHLVLIPVVIETVEIIEPGIVNVSKNKFFSKQCIIVIALEERANEQTKKGIKELQRKYGEQFKDFLIIEHPSDLPGEIPAKGANVTYAAKKMQKYCTQNKINIENVLISCFDSDTVPSLEYFAALTYYFQITPERFKRSFQPIPVYHNNIWEATAFARVLDVGSSFFQLIEATNPEKQVTFSSHSIPFKTLIEVGFWPVDLISEDSAIYWKSLLHFKGDYRVVPMHITVSMDVTTANTWWDSVKSVYKQRRRWAWGAENFPIVMRGFLHIKNIPLMRKIKLTYKLLDRIISWSTWPFLLSIIVWLPLIELYKEFSNTVIYFSYPRIRGTLFLFASIGIANCILLSMLLLPSKKIRYPFLRRIVHVFEWLLVPFAMLFLNGLPALEAQTRLMLGRYMKFWVTPKLRLKNKR